MINIYSFIGKDFQNSKLLSVSDFLTEISAAELIFKYEISFETSVQADSQLTPFTDGFLKQNKSQ